MRTLRAIVQEMLSDFPPPNYHIEDGENRSRVQAYMFSFLAVLK